MDGWVSAGIGDSMVDEDGQKGDGVNGREMSLWEAFPLVQG